MPRNTPVTSPVSNSALQAGKYYSLDGNTWKCAGLVLGTKNVWLFVRHLQFGHRAVRQPPIKMKKTTEEALAMMADQDIRIMRGGSKLGLRPNLPRRGHWNVMTV